jgi:hypothetical protein
MGLEKFIALKADNLIFDNSSKDLAQFRVVDHNFFSSDNDSKISVSFCLKKQHFIHFMLFIKHQHLLKDEGHRNRVKRLE